MLQGAVLIHPLGVEKFFVLLDGGAYRVDSFVLHGGPAPRLRPAGLLLQACTVDGFLFSWATKAYAMNLDYSRHYLTACDPTTYPPCRLDSADDLGPASKTWSTHGGSRLSGNRMAPPEGFMPPLSRYQSNI